jgi:hypothetical protein
MQRRTQEEMERWLALKSRHLKFQIWVGAFCIRESRMRRAISKFITEKIRPI